MHSSDSITTAIQHGDKESFKEFFEDFYPILCAFAKGFLRSTDLSEDVAQEALVKYWERREEFDTINGVKSFLYVIARNNCINVLRKSKKSVDVSLLRELESESFLKKTMINQETFAIVRAAVNSLPERQRAIINLAMLGAKSPEIAEQLGITPNTVRTAKRNAYKKLRVVLKDKYYLLLFV